MVCRHLITHKYAWCVNWLVVDVVECLDGDTFCETDHVGFEAIAELHSQIDDDQDGSLNRAESAEVLMLLTAAALVHSYIYNVVATIRADLLHAGSHRGSTARK